MSYRYIDTCSDCGQGLVLIMKDKCTNNLILICDDCESMWRDPESFYLNQGRIPEDSKLQLSDDVTVEDILFHDWEKYVKNLDNPIDL